MVWGLGWQLLIFSTSGGPFVCRVQLKADGPYGAHCVHICMLLFIVKIGIGSHRQTTECISISVFGCPSIFYAVVVLTEHECPLCQSVSS